MALTDTAKFYVVSKTVEKFENMKKEAERGLSVAYPELIEICPHPEAIEYSFNLRGNGPVRVCKVCGIEDLSSEGGTPGDEYDYGYPGRPSKTFWQDTEVEVTDDEDHFQSFRKGHGAKVVNGKAWHYKWKLS